MRIAVYLSPLLIGLVLFAGCSRSPEDVMSDMVETIEEAAGILEGCKTADDIKAKKSELEELSSKIKELKEEGEGMEDDLSDEDKAEMVKEYLPRIMAASAKLQAAMGVAGTDADARKVVESVMKGM